MQEAMRCSTYLFRFTEAECAQDRWQDLSYMQCSAAQRSATPSPPSRHSRSSEPSQTRANPPNFNAASLRYTNLDWELFSSVLKYLDMYVHTYYSIFTATWDNEERQQAPHDATNYPGLALQDVLSSYDPDTKPDLEFCSKGLETIATQ